MKKIKIVVLVFILILSASASMADTAKKVLYYRNPMRGDVHSPVPAKDEMGMDYIPVYEETSGVVLTPEKKKLLGVKTAVVEKKELKKIIRALGMVGHEEALYDAQVEYLRALRGASNAAREKYLGVYQKQFAPTAVESAKLKLMQLGMDEASIAEMDKNTPPDKALLHLADHSMDWVSFTLYEYEAALVKRGAPVRVEIPSIPGESLEGKVRMISLFVDEASRTIKGRALVRDQRNILKPNMYVTVIVNSGMGAAIVVPADAVLLTGTRSMVYVEEDEGKFQPREVVVGAEAGGFYEIKQGLNEGEKVAISGNFLLDSESRMNAPGNAS